MPSGISPNKTMTHGRFETVANLDMGNRFKVVIAKDIEFNNISICVIAVPLEALKTEWAREALFLRCQLNHPHVLKFFDVHVSNSELQLSFERPKGDDLLQLFMLHRFSEALIRNMFQQLVFAVSYFHDMGIMGIDLVLERIFYDSETGILKTTDFGFEATDGFEDCDTLPYIPPERLQSPTQQNKYSKENDVWRLGVILYSMLFRCFPFYPHSTGSRTEHIKNILRGSFKLPEGDYPNSHCRHLLRRIFTLSPKDRISLSEIKQHPWYQEGLPDGVMNYEYIKRPMDGFLQKMKEILEMPGLYHSFPVSVPEEADFRRKRHQMIDIRTGMMPM